MEWTHNTTVWQSEVLEKLRINFSERKLAAIFSFVRSSNGGTVHRILHCSGQLGHPSILFEVSVTALHMFTEVVMMRELKLDTGTIWTRRISAKFDCNPFPENVLDNVSDLSKSPNVLLWDNFLSLVFVKSGFLNSEIAAASRTSVNLQQYPAQDVYVTTA